jgi:hypothetical protein
LLNYVNDNGRRVLRHHFLQISESKQPPRLLLPRSRKPRLLVRLAKGSNGYSIGMNEFPPWSDALPMPRKATIERQDKFVSPYDLRKEGGQNQTVFWGRYGVLQPSASRYERGTKLPLPLSLLVTLHQRNYFSDGDLEQARDWLLQQKSLPLTAWREEEGLSQRIFWQRYGITQCGGSRYERERSPPIALCLLMTLHRQKKIYSKDLEELRLYFCNKARRSTIQKKLGHKG